MLTDEKFELWYRQLTEPTVDFRLTKDDMRMCWIEAYRLGHAAGVAAEQRRILSVLAKMIDGDSPQHDHTITDAMNRIERGEDVS